MKAMIFWLWLTVAVAVELTPGLPWSVIIISLAIVHVLVTAFEMANK